MMATVNEANDTAGMAPEYQIYSSGEPVDIPKRELSTQSASSSYGSEESRLSALSSAGSRADHESTGVRRNSRISTFFHTPSFIMNQKEQSIILSAPTASESDLMWNETFLSKISQSDKFQNLTLAIICVNALWIGGDTEWNHANIPTDDGNLPLEPVSTVIENLFCTYFTLEVLIRFLSYRRKRSCMSDAWFVFDSILVFFMIMETWVLKIYQEAVGGGSGAAVLSNFSALRLMRLLRLTRMARLMQSVPELMMLVKGMISATKAVGFIILFLVLVMYVFAIIMMSVIAAPGEYEEETAGFIFGSMGDAMMTLLTNGVLGDNLNQCVSAILEEGLMVTCVFWLFFTISSLTLLNMLIGVLCEVIGKKADEEKELMGETEMRTTFAEAFEILDTNMDGRVTRLEWEQLKTNPSVLKSFGNQGIEPELMEESLEKMSECIFTKKNESDKEGGGLCLDDFVSKLLEVQPAKAASCLELKLLRSKVEMRDGKLCTYLETLEAEINNLLTSRGMEPMETTPTPKEKAQAKREKEQAKLDGKSNPLLEISTKDLFLALKGRTSSEPPRDAPPTPVVLQSAFPTPQANGQTNITGPQMSLVQEAVTLPILREPDIISHEERVLARQHPLFKELEDRRPELGWATARTIATELETRKVTVQDLSRILGVDSVVADVRSLLDEIPELFDQESLNAYRLNEMRDHVHGCPRHQTVRRLCDALQFFTEGG